MACQQLDVLVFEVGGHRYGLSATDVRELVRAVALVPLPQAPAIVEGVINLHGKIVPVLDVRSRFHLPARAIEPSDQFIIASAGDRVVALRVDRALDLLKIDQTDLVDATSLLPGIEYVASVARLPDGLLLIHDLRVFLSSDESIDLAEALRTESASVS